MIQIVSIPLGTAGSVVVDENAGTLTINVNVTVDGVPDNFSVPIPIGPLLTGLASGITNPLLKWALSFVISML